LSRKNDHHVELAFDAMATRPTLELAAERLKEEYGITTTPQVLEAVRRCSRHGAAGRIET
jgi:hypothetical protein